GQKTLKFNHKFCLRIDLFDGESLPWKRAADKNKVITMKEKFIKLQYPKSFKVVPGEVRRIIQYIDGMDYADEPDYLYIQNALRAIAKERKIDLTKQLDWVGRKRVKSAEPDDESTTSSDMRKTGEEGEEGSLDSNDKLRKKKSAVNLLKK
ncbi:hypothetical protein OSTOST_23883, partial [Ostertagia ostertagi]